MPKLEFETTSSRINDHIDGAIERGNVPRDYMGLSQVGLVYECPRKAFYMMQGIETKPLPGRVLRLFRTGEDIEHNAVTDLNAYGLKVIHQQKKVEATQGDMRFVGHIDGIVRLNHVGFGNEKHLFECKSAKDSSFKKLLKTNSYCAWNETYKAQVHVYAYLLGLERILVMVENKDNSQRYWERIKLDKGYAMTTLQLAFAIMENGLPPREVCQTPAFYLAKWCDYSKQCFSEE